MIEVFYNHDHTNTAGFYYKQLLLVKTVSRHEMVDFLRKKDEWFLQKSKK